MQNSRTRRIKAGSVHATVVIINYPLFHGHASALRRWLRWGEASGHSSREESRFSTARPLVGPQRRCYGWQDPNYDEGTGPPLHQRVLRRPLLSFPNHSASGRLSRIQRYYERPLEPPHRQVTRIDDDPSGRNWWMLAATPVFLPSSGELSGGSTAMFYPSTQPLD